MFSSQTELLTIVFEEDCDFFSKGRNKNEATFLKVKISRLRNFFERRKLKNHQLLFILLLQKTFLSQSGTFRKPVENEN